MNRKVGRPKKAEDKAYNAKVAILLTKKEKMEIEEKAMELNLSINKYLRSKIFQ